ncbi:MAG: DUF6492 family protein [Cyanobacteria bacterium P01_A01_bin.135]
MAQFDIVIPLYRPRWNTRAVMEGLVTHYQPRAIHIVTPDSQVSALQQQAKAWQAPALHIHPEDSFFVATCGLSKDEICAELDMGESLYNPGWFYQQLLKLGAPEGIPGLSEWYVVWDSDLLPVDTWPLLRPTPNGEEHAFALLQHNQWGNPKIVSTWAHWIRTVLEVEPFTDAEGTFIPHHMWFKQAHLDSFKRQVGQYFKSDDSWLRLMMRSANEFGTFSEYWAYVSWVAAKAPEDLAFYPYGEYGATTERFFDDGTGLFSAALRKGLTSATADSPSYKAVEAFIRSAYGADELPSSLSFESSPRHLKKDAANMHIEESRSRWNPRMADSV